MKYDVCFASFKYPSLSRGGVKRPDDILYPSALTERHEKAQQCYQARMFRHFFVFSFTWTCSWQCSMGLPSFCRGQAGTWPAEGNNIRNLSLLYQETKATKWAWFRCQDSSFCSVEEVTIFINWNAKISKTYSNHEIINDQYANLTLAADLLPRLPPPQCLDKKI